MLSHFSWIIGYAVASSPALAQEPAPVAVVAPAVAPAPAPFRLSLVPGVGVNADPDRGTDGFATGVASRMTSLEGMDLELGLSWVDGEMAGAQLSLAGNVAGDVEGLQGSLGANWARGDLRFGQLTLGANVAEGDVAGVQAALGLNLAVEDLIGAQLTTGVNVAAGDDSRGVQLASGVNVARRLEGVQAAPLNVAGDLVGVQLGLLNVGRDVDGLQLGLVNVARTSKVSIAPINLIADGLHHVDLWVSDSALLTGALKIGSKNMYSLIGAGWVNRRQAWWTFGGGWGAHLQRDDLWLEIDDSVWGLAEGNVIAPGVHNKLRVQAGLALREHFQPFVGVSMNTWFGTGDVWVRPDGLPATISSGRRVVAWPGLHAGISL